MVIPADSFWSGQEGSPALVELTVMQKMTCYDLVYQHYQLVSVLYLVTQHGLKSVRPLTYFDGKVCVEGVCFFYLTILMVDWEMGDSLSFAYFLGEFRVEG